MKTTKRLIISGRVQGVGYRYSMFYAAKRFDLAGWVRNRQDGTVESLVYGDEKAIQDYIAWAHKGPELAHVESVQVFDAEGEFAEFEIEDTI